MGLEAKLTLAKFEAACEAVGQVTLDTSLIYSDYFSERTGGKVYLKPENRQRTGAYKVRGAYYKISTLSDEERAKGLITASAGNHAQGVAYAAQRFGAKAVIVMPTTTPLIKVNRTKALGAEVVLYGDVYDEACSKALELAAEHGYTFIHPFDDPDVATGQGTIAMEIIKDLPLVDIILVPVGGGGLATGVSTLVKMLKPNTKVIGVEPEGAACLKASLEAGSRVPILIEASSLTNSWGQMMANQGRDRSLLLYHIAHQLFQCPMPEPFAQDPELSPKEVQWPVISGPLEDSAAMLAGEFSREGTGQAQYVLILVGLEEAPNAPDIATLYRETAAFPNLQVISLTSEPGFAWKNPSDFLRINPKDGESAIVNEAVKWMLYFDEMNNTVKCRVAPLPCHQLEIIRGSGSNKEPGNQDTTA